MLNVTEDHMDRYGFRRLSPSKKLRIYHNAETAVVNLEDKLTFGEGKSSLRRWHSLQNQADYWLKPKMVNST